MTDLKVDYALLDQSETTLSGLVSEFENIRAQESAYDGAMGSGDIASAMGSFAGTGITTARSWSDPCRRSAR